MLLEEDVSLRNILVTRPGPQASEEELCLVHEIRYSKDFIGKDMVELCCRLCDRLAT